MGKIRLPWLLRPLNILRLEIKILWRFRDSFSILKKTIRLGEQIICSEKIVWDENNPFMQLTILFSASGIHRLQSVYILCKKGFARDTVPLLRVSFEALVDFKVLYQERSKIKDYIDYDIYRRLTLISEEVISTYPIETQQIIKDQNKKLREQWNLVKDRFSYQDRDKRVRIFSRWSGKEGLPELAKKVGLGAVYRQIWGFFSNYSHGNSITLNSYNLGIIDDKVRVEIGSSPEFVEEALLSSVSNYLDLFSLINQEFKLGLDNQIKKIDKGLKLQVRPK